MQDDKSTPFWLSRKFWYAVLATVAFVVLAVTGTVTFTSDQVMTFILALLGVTTGLHAATDIGSQIARALVLKNGASPPSTETSTGTATATPETDGDEEDPDEA